MIFLKWSRPAVLSLAGQDCNAVMYVPGKGAFCLKSGAKAGEPLTWEKEKKLKELQQEFSRYAGKGRELDPLVIAQTDCMKSAESAIAKLGESLIA